ncbi:MAG: hypothetical protein IAF94_06355 [Pirellulaceae bacterium]|nr:hypothetical protein [Pirellulaceae bacterium]
MKENKIVAEVRRVREKLVKKHGGLIGWMKHLRKMDEKRLEAEKVNLAKNGKQTTKGKSEKSKKPKP